MENEYTSMKECAAEAARVARGVDAARLPEPSGCGDWDVRALVNHWVLYTSHGLEHRALRTTLPDELTARDFTADTGWAEAYAVQLDKAVAAWSDPAVWEGEIDLGFARMPAPAIAALLIAELALHGWDVAHATGQDYRVSDDTARLLYGVVEANAEEYRQYDGFAEPVPVPDDAPLFHRALALSGRDPR
ncbi:TIGR03086 family protein [Streptomyces antnestii]|uniref:TIGR03086 family protein n=1 Tax=Streptomyces antnestii TaxID=2494256 RepID=A0A437Q227_9ACTN|nr:TIGR03086 family metal-binding protein [Streptomyces sp. San01]RVU28564.1 TIGR03086 family protein [Streptomyces sp. San01]